MAKRLFSALMAIAMLFALVACGSTPSSNEPVDSSAAPSETAAEAPAKDPVTIVYWYKNNIGVQEYTEQVETKLNEILSNTEGYEHITIELHPCNDQYATAVALGQATGEQMDVVSEVSLDWFKEATNGAIIPLNDLLAANPEITEELPDWMLKYGVIDGQSFIVPNYQQAANQYFFVTSREWLDAYLTESGQTADEIQRYIWDRDVENIANFLENYVLFVREYTNTDTKWVWSDTFSHYRFWGVDDPVNIYNVTGQARFCVDDEGKVFFTLGEDSPVSKAYVKQGEWYANGLIYKDVQTDTKLCTKNNFMEENSMVFFLNQSFGSNEDASKAISEQYGKDLVAMSLHENIMVGPTNAASGVAISATCEHPEEAAMVMALLFNSKYSDFYNTLCYGVEGIHYNTIDDNNIETLEFTGTQAGAESTYCYWKWVGGNTFNAWLNQSMTDAQEDFILNVVNEGPDTLKSKFIGLNVDGSMIETEIAQLKSVYAEYFTTLSCGTKGGDAEAYYNEFITKMEAAGLSKVIAEFQSQVDAFLANQ